MGPLAAARHGLQTVVRQENGEEPNPEIILKYLTESVGTSHKQKSHTKGGLPC